jgi:UDP-2-acetamido-2-deoxy-ribo-hexuluronate aminotransferase
MSDAPAPQAAPPLAFIDLMAQRRRLGARVDAAVSRVLDHGQFIMGPEVRAFETALGAFGQARHVLSCANGTDALVLPLIAWGVGPGDAVFCPSFSFAATAEVVPWLGATPVFVDVRPDTYGLDPASLEAAVADVQAQGRLRPRAVIAVDLFGQPADYPAVSEVARRHGLKLLADSAQGFGCTLHGRHPLSWSDAATTSFFPAKPLGAYGDGGAVLTDDAELHAVLVSLRNHGAGEDKYDNVRIGMNSRLDTIQAAILLEKLAAFPAEIEARDAAANRYAELLDGVVRTPTVIAGGTSTWAQYTVEVEGGAAARDAVMARLKAEGVPTAAYYPRPIHRQSAYAQYPLAPGGLPATDRAAERVFSLPMHPDLDAATQSRIAEAVKRAVA